MNNKFYITTTLPYVNSDPHIGFAMEIIRADVIARYKRSLGYDVFFNTGTDEHGAKIYENAQKLNVDTQEYVDGYANKFKELISLLNIKDVNFIRTTDKNHILSAEEMWRRCKANGDIYKKEYKVKYCVGCELEKTDSELDNGKCPIHPNREIEEREEENYFFRFSNYQKKLLDFYESNPTFVIPDFRFNEIKSFVSKGLEDFSISRLKSKMPWGVNVPDDENHVMYVWFDALTSYISTLGWGVDEKNFSYWVLGTPVQYCGKDNLRQQSAMWQAMLMSSSLPNSSHIIIDGFITSGGQKMSKSIGNVISPFEIVEIFKDLTDFPEDVLRFILLRDILSFDDGDITIESIKDSYKSNLQNGIGNLTNRIMKMAISSGVTLSNFENVLDKKVKDNLDLYDCKKAMDVIVNKMSEVDKKIQEEEPFKVVKLDKEKGEKMIQELISSLCSIAIDLSIFLPKTSEKIIECIKENKMPEKPLFARLG